MAGHDGQRSWKRRSREEWQQLLQRSKGSGLSVEAFCRQEGISAASFYRWRGLLGEPLGMAVREPAGGSFLDLGLLGGTAAPAGGRLEVRLDLGNGVVLQLVRS